MSRVPGETTQQVLQRRYVSRMISRRKARADARNAASQGRATEAAELSAQASQHLGACAEAAKIARDLGMPLDTYALTTWAKEFGREIEETLRIFEATRHEEEDRGAGRLAPARLAEVEAEINRLESGPSTRQTTGLAPGYYSELQRERASIRDDLEIADDVLRYLDGEDIQRG